MNEVNEYRKILARGASKVCIKRMDHKMSHKNDVITIIREKFPRAKNFQFFTKALFHEYRSEVLQKSKTKTHPFEECPFTLKPYDIRDKDGNVVSKSLKSLYLAYEDPYEYRFAEDVFGSYPHWELLSKTTFMVPHITKWREELGRKLKSIAFKTIIKQTKKGSINAANAMFSREWERINKRDVGRPKSTRELEEQKQKNIEHLHATKEDLKRLQLQ